MFLIGVVAVIGLIWRWVKGKGDEKVAETAIQETLALEPNEVNDVSLMIFRHTLTLF